MNASPGRAKLLSGLAIAAVFLVVVAATSFWLLRSYVFVTRATVILPAAAPPAAPVSAPASGPSIGGVVRNELGAPVPGARVELQWWHEGDTTKGERGGRIYSGERAITDLQGQWHHFGIPRDLLPNLYLNFIHKEYIAQSISTDETAALLNHSLVVVLQAGFDISGQVVNAQNQPVSGARVITEGDQDSSGRSDRSGRFVIHHVPSGSVVILATAKGYAPALADTVAGVNPPPVKIRLSPGLTISGRVLDQSGKPVAGVRVSVLQWQSRPLNWTAQTDATGRFKMPDAPSDPLTLTFSKNGYENPAKVFTAGRPEEVVTLGRLPIFSGRVADARTHQPIDHFQTVTGAHWPGWSGPIYDFGNAATCSNGTYTLKPGGFGGEVLQWYVRIQADGYLPAFASSNGQGGPLKRDFELVRAPDIQGQLLDTAGKPVADARMMLLTPNASVYVQDTQPEQEQFAAQSLKTDDRGTFRFHPQITPFEIWAITDAGCAHQRFAGDYDGKPIQMTLLPWASLHIRASASDAGNPASIRANIDHPDDPLRVYNFSHWSFTATPFGARDFLVKRLPALNPGALSVVGISLSQGNDYRETSTLLTLTPGKTTLLDLAAGVTVTGHARPSIGTDTANTKPGYIQFAALPDTAPAQWPLDWVTAAQVSPIRLFYSAPINSDGYFTLSGVASGNYEYAVSIPSETRSVAGGMLNVPVGAKALSAPDIFYRQSPLLTAGDPAPPTLGRTLDNAPIRPTDYPGRYIVWMTWDDTSSALDPNTPPLRALADQFAADPRITLIATNAARAAGSYNDLPARRLPALPHWINGYLSLVDESLFTSLDYYQQRSPLIFIISPAGKIAAADVSPDQVATTLAHLLAAR